MATSDTELIGEVRAFTDYQPADIDDATMQELVNIGKEEIRSYMGLPDFNFYQDGATNSLDADRALFWFTCLGTKVRTGELGSVSLTIDGLKSAQPTEATYQFWQSQFFSRLGSAQTQLNDSGAASTTLERTDRTYSFDQPT